MRSIGECVHERTVFSCLTDAFCNSYVNELVNERQLYRIVFDEIHMVLTDSGYLETFLYTPSLNIHDTQIIGLTATLPPELVPAFSEATQNIWWVIRMPSNRTEIAYRIRV